MRSLDHGWRYQDAYHLYNFSNCRSIMLLPGWQHPQFMAYYPSSSSVPAILSETVIASIGSVGLQWKSNPIGTELEVVVMDPRCLWCHGVCVCFSKKELWRETHALISSTTPNPSHRKISNTVPAARIGWPSFWIWDQHFIIHLAWAAALSKILQVRSLKTSES